MYEGVVNGILTRFLGSLSAYKAGPDADPDADNVQSRWVMTGKACGLIVENWPQRLWKEPGSIAHNGISNAPCRLWIEGGYFTATTLAQTKKTGRLARARSETPPKWAITSARC
jgi:hypothetical protein